MLVDSFLDYLSLEKNYSEKTTRNYGVDIRQFSVFLWPEVEGEPEWKNVESESVREWIVSLMDLGYTATSVNRKLSSLRSFYKFLLRRGVVTVDPMRKINGPKNKKPLPTFIKEADMNRLLDDMDFGEGFQGVRDHLIIQMFYETGMRLSELIGLKVSDVDFSLKQVKVLGKRNKERLIPFGEELEKAMTAYLDIKGVTAGESDTFFIRKDGEPLYAGLVGRIVKRSLSKVVTSKKRSPHVLRHTFATMMLNNEAELGAVKELLGHETIATTAIYTHTTFEELKKVYNQAHPRA